MARNKFDIDEVLQQENEFNFSHLKRLGRYMLPYKKNIALSVAVMLVSGLLALLPPYLMKLAIDTYIPQKDYRSIIISSIILLASLAINIVLIRFKVLNMSTVGQSIIRDMRLDLFKHLQELPFSFYDSRPHGKILVRVVNYVNSLSDMLSNGLINLITDLFSLLVIVVIMLSLNVPLTLVCMSGLPILFIVTYLIKVKQRTAWQLNSAKQSNMNAFIHESIAGMKITQGFVREDENMKIFSSVTDVVKSTWLKACSIMFIMVPSADNIAVWSTSLLYVCGLAWMSGNTAITVGVLVAFVGYIGRFWGPINNIANVYNTLVVNMAYLERIFETIDEPVLVKDVPNARKMPLIKGHVEFRNVTFCYDPGRPILKDVSFTCNSGETIALVGPTGAGKSTVVNLISRFYDIESGSVLIDGVDIKNVTLNSLRSQMGIMLQDSFIFSGTIMDNIRYSRLDATDEQVIEAAKAVRAHEFITKMENGYQTEVNERGSRLSVGERQLISFARALLADPKILILDEATSSIDTETEKALQEGLDRLLVGRTSFIIAHRLSTIKNATRIMYIGDGTILEAGSHDQLMELKGHYHKLYESQYEFLRGRN